MGSSPHVTETGLGLGDGFGLQRGKEPPTAVTSVTMRCLESRCELGALFWPFNSARPFNRRYTHPFRYQYHAPYLRALLTCNCVLIFCLPARY